MTTEWRLTCADRLQSTTLQARTGQPPLADAYGFGVPSF